ncbi:RimJ/RimL family protein N-acetyltransferase [Homoserinimonas aerilata]|uniref:RimJ/RimL family protein N-acetyltransferase n=1 Tax=Homoserinimonas aerilata TaxID=1162970 RepID=A0A542YFB0_9MICO|nr:GNAT family protein [Homoserinimonas aerilata]TQL46775.1 RimJ/RimL family protein N-acetyltransferase [Homoserinimonas aerilata]
MTAKRPQPERLEGRYISLEPLRDEHMPALFAAIGHPQVFAGGYGGGPAGLSDTAEGFAEWARGYYPFASGIPYAVLLRGGPHDGEVIGTSSLADFDVENESTHIGWTAYAPQVWGTAVNAEAKLLLLGHAFDSGFGRVKIQADAINQRSRAAIAGIGAAFEGVLRRVRRRADGSWRDTAVYSILLEEWPDVRAGLEQRLAAQGGRPVLFRGLPD